MSAGLLDGMARYCVLVSLSIPVVINKVKLGTLSLLQWSLSIVTTSYHTSLSSWAHPGGTGPPGWALEDIEGDRMRNDLSSVCINHFTKWKTGNRLHYEGGRYWQVLLYILVTIACYPAQPAPLCRWTFCRLPLCEIVQNLIHLHIPYKALFFDNIYVIGYAYKRIHVTT